MQSADGSRSETRRLSLAVVRSRCVCVCLCVCVWIWDEICWLQYAVCEEREPFWIFDISPARFHLLAFTRPRLTHTHTHTHTRAFCPCCDAAGRLVEAQRGIRNLLFSRAGGSTLFMLAWAVARLHAARVRREAGAALHCYTRARPMHLTPHAPVLQPTQSCRSNDEPHAGTACDAPRPAIGRKAQLHPIPPCKCGYANLGCSWLDVQTEARIPSLAVPDGC